MHLQGLRLGAGGLGGLLCRPLPCLRIFEPFCQVRLDSAGRLRSLLRLLRYDWIIVSRLID